MHQLKDLKYFAAYVLPLSGFLGIYFGGIWSFGAFYTSFILIPFVELFTPAQGNNHAPETEQARSKLRLFDLLLYLNLPLLYSLIAYALYVATTRELSGLETTGTILNIGCLIGTMGINVGHELGHRTTAYERYLAQALLLTGLYTHFYIEHNRGHHKNVSTPLDPATSRKGESVYEFWLRSSIGGYFGAWKLEAERLSKVGKTFFGWHNLMIRFTLAQLLYLGVITSIFGVTGLWLAVAMAVVGFLLLESVNYIEHYGLMRKQLPNGRFEAVSPRHSWNSEHELGRIILYELTRHSDHHFRATRKYQILRKFEESPQLPLGYPGSILLSLVPPLWFRTVDPRLPNV
jgi:alkane 1-monooxygenase